MVMAAVSVVVEGMMVAREVLVMMVPTPLHRFTRGCSTVRADRSSGSNPERPPLGPGAARPLVFPQGLGFPVPLTQPVPLQ